jgi:hypothetical protein
VVNLAPVPKKKLLERLGFAKSISLEQRFISFILPHEHVPAGTYKHYNYKTLKKNKVNPVTLQG